MHAMGSDLIHCNDVQNNNRTTKMMTTTATTTTPVQRIQLGLPSALPLEQKMLRSRIQVQQHRNRTLES